MDCEKVQELQPLYIIGAISISSAEHQQIRDHLKVCPACSAMLDETAGFIQAVDKAYKALKPPSHLEGKILKAIQQEEIASYGWLCWVAPLGAVALVLISLIAIFLQPAMEEFEEIPIKWEEFGKGISLADGSTLRVAVGSKYQITGHRSLSLQHGQLWLDVVKKVGQPFQIETPLGKVMVKGTEFVVQVIVKERRQEMKVLGGVMAVLVISGIVELVNPEGKEVAGPGQYVYAQQGKKPIKRQARQQKPRLGPKLIVWGDRGIAVHISSTVLHMTS